MSKKHILIIEDEKDMAELIAHRLEGEGYSVSIVHDGQKGLKKIMDSPPDLVLLDLMLPGLSGLEIARKTRAESKTVDIPIMMVTALGEEGDIVAGLQLGADDYITKPFSMAELAARVAALLRRSGNSEKPQRVVQVGPITIDTNRHEVAVDGEPVSLTLTEFKLLLALATARGRVLTRNQLIDHAIGVDTIVTDRTVDVHMAGLRRKLGPARELLKTVRGVGYRIQEEEQ